MVCLANVVALLPVLGDGDVTLIELVSVYALVLLPVGTLLYGLLLLGVAAGVVGTAAAYLGGSPEELIEGSAVRPLALLFLSDVARLVAAACIGLAFARCVTSHPG